MKSRPRKRRIVVIFVLLSVIGVGTINGDISVGVPSARSSALGGSHAAYTRDLSSLFNNPAGFVMAEPQLSVAELTVGASGPIFDISTIVIQAVGGSDLTSLLGSTQAQNLLRNIYAQTVAAGPVYFGYIGKGIGFGFFNTTDITFRNSRPLTLQAVLGEQVILSGGYGLHLPFNIEPHSIDLGILLNGVLRGEVTIEETFVELPTLFSNISFDTVTGSPFDFVVGIGVDAGFRYSIGDVFAFGLVAKNLFTPTIKQSYSTLQAFLDNTETPDKANGRLPIELSAGFYVSPNMGRFERFINDLTILLDYEDILDFVFTPSTARNPVLHVGFGTEITILQILSLRGGFKDGLFAAGLGIDLSVFRLHLSMFGSELSTEPGYRSVYNARLGLEFRL